MQKQRWPAAYWPRPVFRGYLRFGTDAQQVHILYLLHQLLFREGAAQLAHGSIAGILEMLYGLITDIFKEQMLIFSLG